MRTEEIVAKALEKTGDDRYLLSNLVFSRVKQLSAGAKPLVDMDLRQNKLSDIAMREIAEGKVSIERIDERNI
ncbi:DNA-directed RNA polymerase subunit omega [Helicobacter sp. 12S02634-8]|uniref:DNA-directed RNA polymerase subunit omega n=1 Tax=Helicobacter sp. 12S02634-8 TaxID=1476199 RepID=UPI000BA53DD0|nr:DNA-directed RNA polymerase subunit omega [Helicobacter sp. 12S02634-8]PAF48557.1 DNA-directed RNA polymerase subunit omega [Helicobacter sp. 12S02634-8]